MSRLTTAEIVALIVSFVLALGIGSRSGWGWFLVGVALIAAMAWALVRLHVVDERRHAEVWARRDREARARASQAVSDRITRRLRAGIDQGSISPTVALVGGSAIAGCWFVYTRPAVAVALLLWSLAIVTFVAIVACLGWAVLFYQPGMLSLRWRDVARFLRLRWPSRVESVGVVDHDAVAEGLVDPIEADDLRLPYGGGF